MRVTLEELIVETTRRCNMQCGHCLRGEAQEIDLSLSDVELLFRCVDHIGAIVFSGGEPSLAIDKINSVIDLAKQLNVTFGNFYIATNAKVVTDDFMMVIARLYAFCTDNEISAVNHSSDQYHEDVDPNNIRMLEAFRFFEARTDIREDMIIPEGNAEGWGSRRNAPCTESYEIDGNSIMGLLYLNCKGDLIAGCDFSYDSQMEPSKIVATMRATNDPVLTIRTGDDLIKAVKNYMGE